jgi:hypothetical protein
MTAQAGALEQELGITPKLWAMLRSTITLPKP